MNEQATAIKSNTNEINLGFLFSIAIKRFWYLLLAVVVGALGALAITKAFMTPVYSSSAQFRVDITSNNAAISGSNYQMGVSYIANNYVEQVKGNVFLSEIVTIYNKSITNAEGALTAEAVEKGLSTLTVERLAAMIAVTPKAETNIFTVKVSSANKQEAYLLLKVFEDKTPTILSKETDKEFLSVALNNSGSLAKSPDSPNTAMNTILGALLLAVLVYGLFLLLAVWDNTIYDEAILKQHFNVPVVGTLPEWMSSEEAYQRRGVAEELKQKVQGLFKAPTEQCGAADRIERDYEGRLLTTGTPFFIAESLKSLRTNLSYVGAKGEGCCVYGVVSAFAGAGKSLLVANTAISFAQLGKRVLLIDADMRCPVQHKIFKNAVKSRTGLSEVLAGIDGATFESCVCHDEEGGLDLLSSGHIPPNPSELLASNQMKALLAKIKGLYDYVFLDLPPVLETTDAGVLASEVDCYAIVVRAGYSRLNAVADAIEVMQATGARVGGFVLNDINVKGRGFGNYRSKHYYGRYYGSYGRNSTAEK